ncbi:MAG: MFS transporter [Prevotella sp.]|nr:MFS transporter [Prevotella sp.]
MKQEKVTTPLPHREGQGVGLSEKIGYALGDAAAGGITWKVMSIAFPLFFTNVFGLTVADTATLMLIARMFDVVTDPLMGSLADRTQSRWGTYRPWLLFGAVPLGLIFALLLYTPEFGPVGKRIWAYTLYLLMMVVYTAVNVPYGSLLGVMTDNDDEKNQFSSFRMVGAYAMGFVTLLSFPYLQKLVGGTEQHQYAVLGAFFGLIATLGTLACGLLTRERLKPVRAEKFSLKPFADLFRNKPWIYLTLIGIGMNFFNGFRYAVAGYMFEYCLHGEVTVSGLIINYTVFMTFGELTCMVFGGVSPAFTRWIGSKRKAFQVAALISGLASVAYFFIPMDPAYIWVMVAVVIVTSVGVGLFSPLLWSMYADVADYATQKNGTSSTGLIFSSGTMAQKFGTAISGSLVALFLGFAGFMSGTDPATGQTVITITDMESVCGMIWLLFSLFPAAIAFIMIGLIYQYPIKK